MAIESGCAGDVAPLLSLTVTLKVKGLPVAVVGVPLITPVAEFSVSPGGSDPVAVQLPYGGVPPPAAKVAEYGTPTLPPGNDVVVTVTPAPTVIESGFTGEVPPALSFTVTLKLKGLPVAVVGVP